MIRCRHCGTDNLKTARYCDECGARLESGPARRALSSDSSSDERLSGTGQSGSAMISPPAKTLASVDSQPVAEAEPARPVHAAASSDARAGARARLVIIRGGRRGHEFPLSGREWLIGRWDPDHGIFPDIDLDADDPAANVSRRHARILYQDGHYLIEDLGSTNGTFINRGHRLAPGLRHLIRDGDEIIIGKTFFEFKLV